MACEPSLQARWRVRTLRGASNDELLSQAETQPDLSRPVPPESSQSASRDDVVTSNGSVPGPAVRPAGTIQIESSGSPRQPLNPVGLGHSPDGALSLSPLENRRHQSTCSPTTQSFFSFLSNPDMLGLSGLASAMSPYEPSYFGANPGDFGLNFPYLDTESPSSCLGSASAFHMPGSREIEDVSQGPEAANIVMSDALSDTITEILNSADLDAQSVSRYETYLRSLWASFVNQIAPFLTPLGRRATNPFLKFLVPNAEADASLAVAVMYLVQVILGRGRKEPPGPEGRFLEEQAEKVLRDLEDHDPSTFSDFPSSVGATDRNAQALLLTLTIALVFCMAFLASQDAVKLVSHIEYSVVICQILFKTHASDDSFLYLAKLLGFIQDTLLFTQYADNINAPDYLSAALELQDDSLIEGSHEGRGAAAQSRIRFRDMDTFSGMSASIASILHTLGVLVRRKKAGHHGPAVAHAECARTFESEVDGLEARLTRHISRLTKCGKLPHTRPATSVGEEPRFQHALLTQHLDSANEAFLWSAWTVFLTDLKGRPPATDPVVRDAVEHILDACAEIPKGSPVAPTILFPLMIGGMRSTKKVYREFVVARLADMKNLGLSDTRSLHADLVENWWTSAHATNRPIAFSKFVF